MRIFKNTSFTHYILVIVLIAAGIFLRVYDYGEYMHFELDQARDAYVVSDALASGQWPGRGPIARGSELHLGPVFYWFGIISAQVFGFSVESLAYPDLLFGVLALIATYVLVRRVFDQFSALCLLALLSTSLFLITYSRFAWNPNGLYFWSMLLTLSLLWISSTSNRVVVYSAAVLVALCSAILMQLHFFAFFVVPMVVLGYLLWNRHHVTREVFSVIFVSFFFFVSPVLMVELRSGWQNTSALVATITDKGGQDDEHSLPEKVFRATQKTAHFFALSHFGYQGGGGSIGMDLSASQIFRCSDSCKERLPYSAVSLVLFAFSFVVLTLFIRKGERDVFSLTVLWVTGCGLFLSLLAYQISPRFYLFVMPVFALLSGAVISFLRDRFGFLAVSAITFILVCGNLFFVYNDFVVSQDSQSQAIDAPRDSILGRSDRVTLGALRQGAAVVNATATANNRPFIVIGDNRYARALHYLLDIELDNSLLLCYTKRSDVSDGYDTLPVWLLVREGSSRHVPESLMRTHNLGVVENIGTITLYELVPRNQVELGSKAAIPVGCYVR